MAFEPTLSAIGFSEVIKTLGPKLIVALFCGGLIGLERELKNKSAGIKTNMLICVGSMLFTALSVMVAFDGAGENYRPGDPGRIGAQIVSGIGFLGGGAILQSKGNVVGLTTAASIWLVAAVGMWIGVGQLELALFVTVLMVLVLVSVNLFENRFLERRRLFKITLHLREKTDDVTRAALEGLLGNNELSLEDYRENMSDLQPEVRLTYLGRNRDHSRLLLDLWKIPGILDVKQS
jgi:putative Mg2+ transporter-C (MgtC) family protein